MANTPMTWDKEGNLVPLTEQRVQEQAQAGATSVGEYQGPTVLPWRPGRELLKLLLEMIVVVLAFGAISFGLLLVFGMARGFAFGAPGLAFVVWIGLKLFRLFGED